MAERLFYATTYALADGVTRAWPFSFAGVSTAHASGTKPYLFDSDVKVQELYTDADGIHRVVQRSGVLTQANQITIDGDAVVSGRTIRIYRDTEVRFPLVDYRDLQSVSENDLDMANRQAIFIAQETRDAAGANLLQDEMNNFDAKGRRLVNLAPGIDLTDAVNVEQFNRAIRVPRTEQAISELPDANVRANKVLTFDNTGHPVLTAPASGSSLDLAIELAKPTGASKIGYTQGTVSEYLDSMGSATALATELAEPTGSGKVGHGQSTVGEYLDWLGARYVSVAEFKPFQDGVNDDYFAIELARDKAIATGRALLMQGAYRTSKTIDLTACKLVFTDKVEITPLFDAGIAVQWAPASGQIIADVRQLGDLHVKWPVADFTKERVGFVFQNSYHGQFNISCTNTTVGFKTLAEGGRGCVYNDINIGVMANCQVSHWLESKTATSWCNANRIYGGRWYGGAPTNLGLYPSIAGHVVMLGTVYVDNGNEWVSPSLERLGAVGFRLARLRGSNNRVRPVYAEMRGDATWIVDVGSSNKIDVECVPYGGGYDPALSAVESRIDVTGATSPVVHGTFSYKDCGPGRSVHTVSGARPGYVGINRGVGAGLAGQNLGSASRNSIEALGPDGLVGVGIPAAGTWTVHAGTKKVSWSMALIPTAGTWTRGDMVYATNPVASGYIGWVCVASGTPGTWKPWGKIEA